MSIVRHVDPYRPYYDVVHSFENSIPQHGQMGCITLINGEKLCVRRPHHDANRPHHDADRPRPIEPAPASSHRCAATRALTD